MLLSQFPKREWERKRGLYIVEQINLGRGYQSVRCGMAGQRTGDISSGSIGARMQHYLNVWKPTDGKVHALLVVRDYRYMRWRTRDPTHTHMSVRG